MEDIFRSTFRAVFLRCEKIRTLPRTRRAARRWAAIKSRWARHCGALITDSAVLQTRLAKKDVRRNTSGGRGTGTRLANTRSGLMR